MAAKLGCITLAVALVGLAVAAPALSDPDKKSAAVKNLVPNGDFEEGDVTPKGWQTVDGLSTFYVKDADPKRGKVVKMDTDVLQSQAYEWWVKINKGASPKGAPKKVASADPNKYDTLAGLDGVWYWSDFIPIEKGQSYWLTVDAKGPGGGMLGWLVGYPEKTRTEFGSESGAFQEFLQGKLTGKPPDRGRNFEPFIHKYVWKGQLSSLAGTSPTEWKTFSRRQQPFRPTANTPTVRFIRVMLYAYWPPGEYYVDNVSLTEYEEKD
jgi:hypothetical protein